MRYVLWYYGCLDKEAIYYALTGATLESWKKMTFELRLKWYVIWQKIKVSTNETLNVLLNLCGLILLLKPTRMYDAAVVINLVFNSATDFKNISLLCGETTC